ncbi:MAG: DUF4301 family protein [Bacteroidales bacterium]|nr:DUF4301 family protein [Bacteroidales bacterium]
MFTEKDIQQINNKGLTVDKIKNQIQDFIEGFSFLNILKPAIISDGIVKLTDEEITAYIKLYEDLNPDTMKFVPASGAASRMFKFLFEFYEIANEQYENLDQIDDKDVKIFFTNINQFAFYDDLKSVIKTNNLEIEDLSDQGRYKEILKFFLFEDGLDYGQKPKGVLLFHKYKNTIRTAFEEHLIEGINYTQSIDNEVKVHFTISSEHQELFNVLIAKSKKKLEEQFGVKFKISFSQQKPSTDILAVDLNNELFRNTDGSLLFRPGGHGALIENLNDLDSDIIFIKNIDNVVPDKLRETTIQYKKALAGLLLSYQERIFKYIHLIESEDLDKETKQEIKQFIMQELGHDCIKYEEIESGAGNKCLLEILNRPIRVCGMVKNEGEPGGGPFWVKQSNGTVNLQIVESSQIDQNDDQQEAILKSATHFNPVDLVCATKNYKGGRFDLLKYRDLNTGFISKKSKDGRELKAQELPGLWNGAMANWNTIFVEVPIETFNPVKTVNDLLRPEHQ